MWGSWIATNGSDLWRSLPQARVLDRLWLLARMLRQVPRFVFLRPEGTTTVADRIEAQARARADHPVVVFEDRRLTYGDWNAGANRIARWALELGIRRGDCVALLMENRPEYLVCWAGLAKIGATIALLNTNLTGKSLRHAIEVANAGRLILGSECADRFETITSDFARPLDVWWMRDPAPESTPLPPGVNDLDAALGGRSADDPDAAVREGLRSGDNLFYIYTSGTTGLPKAARFSHVRFLLTGEFTASALSLTADDVSYCALPLYHTAGGAMLVSACLSAGATIALRRKFSASRFWDDVRHYKATTFQYIGEFCRYLVNQPPRPDDGRHHVRVAIGNGLRPDIWEAFQKRFAIPEIVEFYGATEGNIVLVNLENRVGSVGRYPFDWMMNGALIRYDVENDAHVRGADGFCVRAAPGEAGELVGYIPPSDSTMQGRFEGYASKEETEQKILRDVFAKGDTYFRTGDLLRQDDEGFFYFVDRIGDTFRWKGENVSTQEVAEAISTYPGTEMAVVYGVGVEGMDGRAGMAAVLLDDSASFDGGGYFALVDEKLPRYAAPLFVRILKEVELTATFKLRKVTLRDEGYDLARVTDPVYFRDDDARAFVPLTPELQADIRSGARRL